MRVVGAVLGLGIVAMLAYLFIPSSELELVLAGLREVIWYEVVALLVLQLITLSIIVYQWTLLLQSVDVGAGNAPRSVRFFPVALRYLGGGLIEAVTPSSKLGGESARIVLFRRRFGIGIGKLAAATGLRALCMTVGLLLVVPPMAAILGGAAVERVFGLGALHTVVAPVAALVALLLGAAVVARLARRYRGALPSKRLLGTLVGTSVLVWLLYPAKVMLAAYVVRVAVAPEALFAATYGAYFLGLLPLTPGGVGVYEAGMIGILAASGVAPSQAAMVALISRTMTFWWPLLLSIVAAGILLAKEASPACLDPFPGSL
ncbi:MAG: UPF0104 family protein [Spirochaetaceae bacterium]|nr:MAG: UPF0104 family protein [Spirochaetaceae bacterium]